MIHITKHPNTTLYEFANLLLFFRRRCGSFRPVVFQISASQYSQKFYKNFLLPWLVSFRIIARHFCGVNTDIEQHTTLFSLNFIKFFNYISRQQFFFLFLNF